MFGFSRHFSVIALGLGFAPGAYAQSFSVIATIPGGPMIGAAHGKILYGTTPGGTLFSVSTSGKYKLLRTFDSSTDGVTPNAVLAINTAGVVSGSTQSGGVYGGGTIFQYSPTAGFTVPHSFGNDGDGATPLQGPVQDGAANIAGTAAGGAINTNGNLYRLSSTGTYTNLHDFMSGLDGHCSFSGVAHSANGTLYGTTVGNGFGGNPNGSVWKLTPAGKLTTIYVFTGGNDGEYPKEAPVADGNGFVYGTTNVGNASGFAGAVWKLSAAGSLTVLHDFVDATDGSFPNSPLILNSDGNLYGTTQYGGSGGYGTLFKITASTGGFSVVHSFSNGSDGANPTGSLTHDAAGAIYGGMSTGQVFKIVP